MAGDYNIDDILSEVKKRREENEKEIKEQAKIKETPIVPPVPAAIKTPPQEEETSSEIPEIPEEPKEREIDPLEGMLNIIELAESEKADPVSETYETEIESETETDKSGEKKKSTKTRKTVIIILSILVVLALLVSVAAVYINSRLDIISPNDIDETVTESEWQGMKTLTENFDPIQETEADELSSLEDMVKNWYYNGSPCSSSHVLNVMLIGEDTRDEEIAEDGTRADAAILASVNIDTKMITLTSVLRDSWSYYETEPGNEDSGRFGKLNEALAYGGLGGYLNAIEHLYKVEIDGYAIVNFDSFETIIDSLYSDGITLELTAKEINEINNHPETYGDVYIEKTFDGDKGEINLDGEQTLAYCRIRHIDSDNARADRQKTTLMQIFSDLKDASSTKQLTIVNELVPYIKTSFNKNDIIKIAKYAISQGWTGFDIQTQNYPEYRVIGGQYKEYNNLWIWKADFPADAYYLQSRIYGKSNITLARMRVDTQNVRRSGFYQKGDSATTAVIRNDHYGEVTTMPVTEEEDEQ